MLIFTNGIGILEALYPRIFRENQCLIMNLNSVLRILVAVGLCVFCGCSKSVPSASTTVQPVSVGTFSDEDPELVALQRERVELAQAFLDAEMKKLETGKSSSFLVREKRRRLLKAKLALASTVQEKVILREQMLEIAEKNEAHTNKRVEVGAAAPLDAKASAYERHKAQYKLQKAKRDLGQK